MFHSLFFSSTNNATQKEIPNYWKHNKTILLNRKMTPIYLQTTNPKFKPTPYIKFAPTHYLTRHKVWRKTQNLTLYLRRL